MVVQHSIANHWLSACHQHFGIVALLHLTYILLLLVVLIAACLGKTLLSMYP